MSAQRSTDVMNTGQQPEAMPPNGLASHAPVSARATSAPHPRYERCIHHLVEEQARRSPDATAVEHRGVGLTYAELNAKANQLAQLLRSRGVGPEAIVGIGLKRSLEFPIALLAVLKAGGACMPLDPGYPAERLSYMQQDAQARILITQPELERAFAQSHAQAVCLAPEWLESRADASPDCADGASPANLAYVVYTSGSSGSPRGVLLSHRALVSYIVEAVPLYRIVPADRVLQFSSLSFDIAIEEIFPTWAAGATLVIRDDDAPPSVDHFLRFIERRRISVLELPTAFWHELVYGAADLKMTLPSSVRQVCVGGETASLSAFKLWAKLTARPVRWINSYGPSEASVVATTWEPEEGEEVGELPIGRPVANTVVHLLDSQLQPVPAGETGELYIGGAGLARGYLNRPEETAKKFIRDPFSAEPGAVLYRTGDLARYREDGNLEFRGRIDLQVKVRGFRIEVEEIEKTLETHPGVRESAVVVQGDATQRLVAFVRPRNGSVAPPTELRDFLKAKLPEYMIPAAFVLVPSMPMLPNGKVDRRTLAQMELDASAGEPGRALDRVEETLLRIWRETLGTRAIGITDNFFEWGGHSLLAIRLMNRIQLAFHKDLPLATLLQAPTVEQLAKLVRMEGWTPPVSSLVPIQPLGERTPLFLVHGVGGHVLRFRALAQYMAPNQPVYALQAQGLDGKHAPLRRVEDMAQRYLEDIRAAQREGPYYLAGYSFGGLVALELARRLTEAGQEVRLLALLDTFAETQVSKGELLSRFLGLSLAEQFEFLARKTRKKIRRTVNGVAFPAALKLVRQCCHEAEEAYVPAAYPGRITLFRPAMKSLRGAEEQEGGWDKIAKRGVDVLEVAGDHGSIIDEPNAQTLARRLLACIEQASA
jgi:aspartate racemase